MWRACVFVLASALCLGVAACSSGDGKKDDKKASTKKDDHDKDHKDHGDHGDHKDHGDHDHDDHGAGGHHPDENDAEDHSASEKPLVIVDDVVAASHGHAKEEFANEHARVIAVELHAGEGLPLHKGGPRIVYAQTKLKFRFVDVHDDHSHGHDAEYAAGTVHGHGAGTHGVKNLADGPAKFLVFLRKPGDKFTASVPEGAQTITESTKYAKSLLPNDDFRVIKVALPPGEKIATHYALNRLVYALGDGKVTHTDADGKAHEHELVAGKVSFHEAGSLAIENSGDSGVVFLIIEMKR